jgi:hypothetical protein
MNGLAKWRRTRTAALVFGLLSTSLALFNIALGFYTLAAVALTVAAICLGAYLIARAEIGAAIRGIFT